MNLQPWQHDLAVSMRKQEIEEILKVNQYRAMMKQSAKPAGRRSIFSIFAFFVALALVGLATMTTYAASPDQAQQEPSSGAPTVTILSPEQAATLAVGAQAANDGAQASAAVPEEPRWALFGDAAKKVAGPAVEIDAQNGIHIAYYDYVPLAERPKAIYLYCPDSAACEKGEGWIGAEFGTDVTRVELAVTKAGKPRLLIEQWGVVFGSGDDYYYAECNASCDQVPSWQIGYVTSRWGTEVSDAFDSTKTRRAFALDAEDRPGFVFYDRNYFHYEPDHIGGFYTWCESNCAAGTKDAPTWQEVYIGGGSEYDTDIYSLPALQYTSNSEPRIVVEVTTGDAGKARMGIIYKSCDSDCDQPASWQHTRIAVRGYENYVGWDLALDSGNRPHVAFYQGSLENEGGSRLFYLTCASACETAANWKTLNLGLERGEGESPDIEIQSNGKPAITYLHSGGTGVYLMRCTGDCSTKTGWKNTILDTATDLETDFPVARPLTCDAGFWDAESTRLGFASDGRMRVVYDAAYQARCLYEDPNYPDDDPYYKYMQIRHAVRILIWEPQGNGGNGGNGTVPPTYLSFVQN